MNYREDIGKKESTDVHIYEPYLYEICSFFKVLASKIIHSVRSSTIKDVLEMICINILGF